MRPLPRLHAVTDAAVLAAPDFGVRAAAIAAGGIGGRTPRPRPAAGGAALARAAARLLALARPAEAAVFVSGRPDVAAALGAQGVQLAAEDLAPADARRILPAGWIGRSVHTEAEAASGGGRGRGFPPRRQRVPDGEPPRPPRGRARPGSRRGGARAGR